MDPNVTTPQKKYKGIQALANRKSGSSFLRKKKFKFTLKEPLT